MSQCCLDNLIGIRGCPPLDSPKSGLYLNDLEGVTLNAAALTANAEQITGLNLMAAKIDLAKRLMRVDLRQRMAQVGGYSFGATLAAFEAGKPLRPNNITQIDTIAKGLIAQKQCQTVAKLHISCITLYPDVTASGVAVQIVDGGDVQTYTVDVVAGMPYTLDVDYVAEHDRVQVLVDQSIAWRQTVIGCKGCGGSSSLRNRYLAIGGYDGSQITGQGYGLTATIRLICQPDAVLCLLPTEDLGLALLYRTGVELMREAAHSERRNYITLTRDRPLELADHWLERYTELLDHLIAASGPMLAAMSDPCVPCRRPLMTFLR